MPNVLQIGPLVLPVSLLFMFVAVVVAASVGKWARRRAGVDVEPILFQTLAVGLVVARLAFVLQFSTTYQASPLAVLDIRDGGWRPLAGFAAAWLFALGRQFKRPVLRQPLLGAVFAATVIWGGSILAVSLPDEEGELPTLALRNADCQRRCSLMLRDGWSAPGPARFQRPAWRKGLSPSIDAIAFSQSTRRGLAFASKDPITKLLQRRFEHG